MSRLRRLGLEWELARRLRIIYAPPGNADVKSELLRR